MKKIILCLLLTLTGIAYAQNDSIHKQRYEVINALYGSFDVEKYGKVNLDKKFFPFLGLGVIISDLKLMEDLMGSCVDLEKNKYYSYSEILSPKEIAELGTQISWFGDYNKLDGKLLTDKVKLVRDRKNIHQAITLPLVYKNKAIIYRTNKNSEETLFVLVKENGEWNVRCVKHIYVHFED
ncbi:hypothetical protein [Salegentibacter mishustinae]|uniref:hypothetical protein n=1 Tax=Salegentibacter mishustinae TaxID=270918 RepID=UPI0024908EB9|nr:hypothetical protein [Salegentibacter mishustinae]